MGLESTIICVDNSDYMRNGDFLPSRLGAQQDAVNLICHAKTRQHPENTVGLVTLVSGQVLITLTQDVGRVLAKLHEVQPNGTIRFISAVRVAQLALKHRLGKNHRQRIVIFVGSPVEDDEKELIKLAKRLKKENVNVDIINFGEDGVNTDKLTKFIDTLNGNSNVASHLVTVPPGPMLSDALLSSPVVAGEDGQPSVPGFGREFGELGIDPNEDPELALALRVSLEEQRFRQEAEARRAAAQALPPGETATPAASNEEAMLQSALGMSSAQATPLLPAAPASVMGSAGFPDFASMTEEEQIAYALHMSLAEQENTSTPMEAEDVSERLSTPAGAQRLPSQTAEEDYSDVMSDPEFLQNVLENLPGVDPQSEEIRNAMSQLSKKDDKKDEKKPSK